MLPSIAAAPRPDRPQPCTARSLPDRFFPSCLQGIERLKRKGQPRAHRRSWKAVKETFGGDFSLNWFNPFSTPCQPKTPSDKDLVRQGPSLSDIDITDTTTTTAEPSEETKEEDSLEVIDE